MAGTYETDRPFSDFIFRNLAIPIIYRQMHWVEEIIDAKELEELDLHHGIDGIIKNNKNQIQTVQFRFRDNYYKGYNDVTLRYRRDNNTDKTRAESEFYKIEADFLMYGITNGKKFHDKRSTNTTFLKWAIINIKELKMAVKNGDIRIIENTHQKQCYLNNGVLHCPVIPNIDDSSSFLPFDVTMLKSLTKYNLVINSYGFS